MVGFKHGNSGKNISREWHETRERARRETWTIEEWGPIEQERYDLDELQFSGKDHPRTYVFYRAVSDDEIRVNGFDVRDLPNRGAP